MKIYKFRYSFDEDEAMFDAEDKFKIENSKFTKEEIKMIFNSCPADKKVLSAYQLIIYNDLLAKRFYICGK